MVLSFEQLRPTHESVVQQDCDNCISCVPLIDGWACMLFMRRSYGSACKWHQLGDIRSEYKASPGWGYKVYRDRQKALVSWLWRDRS